MLYKILLLVILIFPFYAQADNNTMGYGWKVPYIPLHVGGYFSAKYDEEEAETFQFDDIALLFYGTFDKFHFLGEVEASDVSFVSTNEKEDVLANNNKIHIERLRVAYDVGDNALIYIGKFNSDIGYWNQMPINVLEDTTTSPNILRNVFPKLTTGISYIYNFDEGEKVFSLTVQHNHDLDKHYNNILIDRHYALNYKSFDEFFSWSISSGYFRELDKKNAYYAGVGIEKETSSWTLLGELFSKQEKYHDIPYDGYLQATWHLYYGHDIVCRSELYKDNTLQVNENISLLGYTYRPWSSVALKGEYVKHSVLPKSRFVFSFSMIF